MDGCWQSGEVGVGVLSNGRHPRCRVRIQSQVVIEVPHALDANRDPVLSGTRPKLGAEVARSDANQPQSRAEPIDRALEGGGDGSEVGQALEDTDAGCFGRFLERQGLLERDAENSYLAGEAVEGGPMHQLLGSSITYRIAVGPQQGRKVFTLQTLPACDDRFDDEVGKVAGFSLHAGVAARTDQREKLERLCRYISRPAVSEQHLSLTPNGNVRYQHKPVTAHMSREGLLRSGRSVPRWVRSKRAYCRPSATDRK